MTHDTRTATAVVTDQPTVVPDPVCMLTAAQESFADLLAGADPEAAVPTCAPWRVADLALHLAGVHWWASAMALGVSLGGPDPSTPRETERLVEIYGWASGHLRATLLERPLEAPALTLDGPGYAGFWYRRQLHETLVHLVDLGVATGRRAPDVARDTPAAVWADTVDEVVTVMHPRQVRLGRAPAPTVAVDLVATDVHGPSGAIVIAPPHSTWRIGPSGGLSDADGAPAAAPDAVVTGPAWALALLVWGRVDADDPHLEITGGADRTAAVRSVLGRTLVP
ncbi:maleylpyruvate isomerase family mycothiol-dependent enzyme [Luteimicrobium subarcticum]|uniref:Uncharacterized protein (TIGR03083 family) n=1 Tax=Luteimicrobium subarcticum TaxID=620910 RepID=A0A2M8WQX7_9MICO|nr:maleylpyruvate isomerase family mycothiol-dependent enzyme [Luteimicrobium subarcticum]PJI93349.1 uncharacterized protein (TIGR03083 family) [Luteimicrobium subarcticum]